MGVVIYWIIVAAVIILGQVLPQRGCQKKYYVYIIAFMHTFVCAFRYKFLTGDLMKYNTQFLELRSEGYFDSEVINDWKNTGFTWIMKFISDISGGNFQMLLIFLAIFTEAIVAYLILRYSPKPWLSYLVWNCMAFYVTYGFTSIKQGTAMAILMCAVMCIFEERPVLFIGLTLIAGFIHNPALCFLPAYWIAKRKINFRTIIQYFIITVIIVMFTDPIVDFVTDLYYAGNDEIEFIGTSNVLGGRFFVICVVLFTGIVLKGFKEKNFEALFNLIIIAAIFQTFSNYNNVFTRLSDYYLQVVVLYIPMIFYNTDSPINKDYAKPLVLFNERSINIIVMILSVILIWWYYRTCLGVPFASAVDDFTKFSFMWEPR